MIAPLAMVSRIRIFTIVLVVLVVVPGLMLNPYYRLCRAKPLSLPGVLYVCSKQPPDLKAIERGDIVVFDNPLSKDGAGYIKVVRGVPNDQVRREGRHFFLEGQYVGYAKPRAIDGRPLASSVFEGVIPEGYIWVWTPHQDSHDSRYAEVGLIAAEDISARARRVF
ncbi:MAG: S26 family signal peptidase [Alphaproteobacteria bacterium]|nr:S26 family signal peptidase [Alphaproteobacteria bacterium]